MRNVLAVLIVAVLAVFALSSGAAAQGRGGRPLPPGFVAEGVPQMPNPPGPAPKRDLTGTWVGPQKLEMGTIPAMTAAGQAAFAPNHPVPGFPKPGEAAESLAKLAATNDPFTLCDPLGFPRDLVNHSLSFRGGITFEQVQGRTLMLFEQQRIWREVFTDGRELPKKVDARGAPDSRYYGYSVGHWDGDTTFVIDTAGMNPGAWLDEQGHEKSTEAHIQERWTRLDQYNLQVTVTVDDPKFYTQPFQLMKANYYWRKEQTVEEELCLPTEAIEYRDRLAAPSGWGGGNQPAK